MNWRTWIPSATAVIENLKLHPDDYQLQYCWARAVEWQQWPAFVLQPVLPVLYVYFPWKTVLLSVLIANIIWNLLFCTAVVSLPIAVFGLLWARLKWATILICSGYFAWHNEWLLLLLSALTPCVLPILGAVRFRRPNGLIRDHMMLHLGHVAIEPGWALAGYIREADLSQNQMVPHSKPKILLSVSQQAEGFAGGLVELLQSWGYSPTAASNIDEAVEQLRTANFDLVIFDLCDSAVELVPNDLLELHAKILFLTCGHETHNLLLPNGHKDIIEKPVDPLVLLRKLGEMLRQP